MTPMFTAEAALLTGRCYRDECTESDRAVAVPLWSEPRGKVQPIDPGGGADVASCTCPCCLMVNGHLVCC